MRYFKRASLKKELLEIATDISERTVAIEESRMSVLPHQKTVAFHGQKSIILKEGAALSRKRFLACQSCPDVIGSGAGCRHHKGCCFGTWRSKPGNKCPIGKW